MLFFTRMSPHWLFSVIIISIVDVGHPCGRLSVLSSAFAVASQRQIRPDLYIQDGLRCTLELNAHSSYITPTNETHLQSCHYHMEQTLSTSCLQYSGGAKGRGRGGMPPICGFPLSLPPPIWIPRKNKK